MRGFGDRHQLSLDPGACFEGDAETQAGGKIDKVALLQDSP